ncbi:MAG: hypothetical protein Q9198_007091 [Flavoplaca austrocitrina]
MNVQPELNHAEIEYLISAYTDNTNEVIKWLTANGTPDGIARTNLHGVLEGRRLADLIHKKNIIIPPNIERYLRRAVVDRTKVWWNSVRFGGSQPETQRENEKHYFFILMLEDVQKLFDPPVTGVYNPTVREVPEQRETEPRTIPISSVSEFPPLPTMTSQEEQKK